MKFAKILICTILMVAILSVPCFATNEGTYGHYISPGTYVFSDSLSSSVLDELRVECFFYCNGIQYDSLVFRYPNTANGVGFYYGVNTENIRVMYNGVWSSDIYKTIQLINGFYITDPLVFSWWVSNVTRIDSGYDSSFFDEVMSVFTFVGQWISGAAEDLTVMFWADNSLTFVGTLAVASLAMAVSFLIIGLISRFLRFRG